MDDQRLRKTVTRRHLLRSVLVGGAALSLLNACGGAQATPTPAPAATPTPSPTAAAAAAGPVPTVAPGTKITIAMVPKLVHPFFEDCRMGGEQNVRVCRSAAS